MRYIDINNPERVIRLTDHRTPIDRTCARRSGRCELCTR